MGSDSSGSPSAGRQRDSVPPGRGSSRRAGSGPPDHGGDQRRPSRSHPSAEIEEERPRWQDLPPAQRYEVTLTPEARADLRRLYRHDRKTHREIQAPGGLFDSLERTPDLGYPLEGEWEGCFAVHCGRDRFPAGWLTAVTERPRRATAPGAHSDAQILRGDWGAPDRGERWFSSAAGQRPAGVTGPARGAGVRGLRPDARWSP
jgi:mRNA-degrading endonuclease RelE of RelBE toxin-antitoxin system